MNVLCFAPDCSLAEHVVYGDTVLSGTICDFTKELSAENYVTVDMDSCIEPTVFVGKFIDIATDAEPNGYFEITSAQNLGGGKWKFGVGDCSFVTGFVDREAKEKGYTYIISENADFTIMM